MNNICARLSSVYPDHLVDRDFVAGRPTLYAGERVGNTLQTTALVNEVYLRHIDVKNVDWL
jgi:hypothetical protein